MMRSNSMTLWFATGICAVLFTGSAMAVQVACSWGGNVKAVGSKAIPTNSFSGQQFVPLFHTGNWQFNVYYDDADGIQIQTIDLKTGVTENMAATTNNGSASYLNLVSKGGFGVSVICRLGGSERTDNSGAIAAGAMKALLRLNANLMQNMKACEANSERLSKLTKQCTDAI